MEQQELFDIPSPCINVCEANSKGFCKGCLRSREERLNWRNFSNEEKKRVLRRCVARKRKFLAETMALNKKSAQNTAENRQENLFG